jgi:hypothetical protein
MGFPRQLHAWHAYFDMNISNVSPGQHPIPPPTELSLGRAVLFYDRYYAYAPNPYEPNRIPAPAG